MTAARNSPITVPIGPAEGRNELPGITKQPQPIMEPTATARTSILRICFFIVTPLFSVRIDFVHDCGYILSSHFPFFNKLLLGRFEQTRTYLAIFARDAHFWHRYCAILCVMFVNRGENFYSRGHCKCTWKVT